MTYVTYTKNLETIKYLVEHQQAGTCQELAKRLNVSERTVQRMLRQLRSSGYPVQYNRPKGIYEVPKIGQ